MKRTAEKERRDEHDLGWMTIPTSSQPILRHSLPYSLPSSFHCAVKKHKKTMITRGTSGVLILLFSGVQMHAKEVRWRIV